MKRAWVALILSSLLGCAFFGLMGIIALPFMLGTSLALFVIFKARGWPNWWQTTLAGEVDPQLSAIRRFWARVRSSLSGIRYRRCAHESRAQSIPSLADEISPHRFLPATVSSNADSSGVWCTPRHVRVSSAAASIKTTYSTLRLETSIWTRAAA